MFTRKNPYYMWSLIAVQAFFAVYGFANNHEYMAGFFCFCVGANMAWWMSGNPPDSF